MRLTERLSEDIVISNLSFGKLRIAKKCQCVKGGDPTSPRLREGTVGLLCQGWGSDPRPAVYDTAALPLSYPDNVPRSGVGLFYERVSKKATLRQAQGKPLLAGDADAGTVKK